MPRRHRVPAWRRQEILEAEFEKSQRHHGGVANLFGGDVDAIRAQAQRDVPAYYTHTLGYVCVTCRDQAGPSAIRLSADPTTNCTVCGRPVGAAHDTPR